MRWKAYFHLNPKARGNRKETFGFNSRKSPPVIDEMRVFETRLTNMIQNIEYYKYNNEFQNKIKRDLNNIDNTMLLVKADKTSNYYKMKPNDYNTLLNENIEKNYKKSDPSILQDINSEAKIIAEKLEIDDRVEVLAERSSFLTLKDHKPTFINSPDCRLIGPTKSELGRVSKELLQKIVKSTIQKTQVNLWKNTASVLNWFNSASEKEKASFISFDVVSFYPSITEKLLNKALDYVSQFQSISPLERQVILHCKKTIIFHDNEPWAKKDNKLFDVTMGSYDGAETCEVVGIYLLAQLAEKLDKNKVSLGLYRDDGLAMHTGTPKEIEVCKKDICKVFKENDLNITVDANLRVVHFLDVTLNLNTCKHEPYLKTGNTITYINAKSNHPPAVIKAVPRGINTRLSQISSDEETFNKSIAPYQAALNNSGFKYTLKYNPQHHQSGPKKPSRRRSIIWFNPPYNKGVKTNVGKIFFRILRESFTEGHIFRKIFNKNTIKLSYSCMDNIASTIKRKNKRLLNNSKTCENLPCNCRVKTDCPLNGDCRKKNIIYSATVKTTQGNETYTGLTETEFKTRLANHKQSFQKEKLRKATELSKHIWSLKEKNINYDIKWEIIGRANSYSKQTKKCQLCLLEKFNIICNKSKATLNSKSELINTCRHSKKFLLSSVT